MRFLDRGGLKEERRKGGKEERRNWIHGWTSLEAG
jgi:hypothetical protein